MKDMLRISRVALVLLEQNDFKPRRRNKSNTLGKWSRGTWYRDYVSLLKQSVPSECISVTPASCLPGPTHEISGAFIEVNLKQIKNHPLSRHRRDQEVDSI